MLRSIIATEELVGQKISAKTKASEPAINQSSSTGNKDAHESGLLLLVYSCTEKGGYLKYQI